MITVKINLKKEENGKMKNIKNKFSNIFKIAFLMVAFSTLSNNNALKPKMMEYPLKNKKFIEQCKKFKKNFLYYDSLLKYFNSNLNFKNIDLKMQNDEITQQIDNSNINNLKKSDLTEIKKENIEGEEKSKNPLANEKSKSKTINSFFKNEKPNTLRDLLKEEKVKEMLKKVNIIKMLENKKNSDVIKNENFTVNNSNNENIKNNEEELNETPNFNLVQNKNEESNLTFNTFNPSKNKESKNKQSKNKQSKNKQNNSHNKLENNSVIKMKYMPNKNGMLKLKNMIPYYLNQVKKKTGNRYIDNNGFVCKDLIYDYVNKNKLKKNKEGEFIPEKVQIIKGKTETLNSKNIIQEFKEKNNSSLLQNKIRNNSSLLQNKINNVEKNKIENRNGCMYIQEN